MKRKDYFSILKEIKENYKIWKPRSDPYSFYNWLNFLTPIEHNVWANIRYLGIPFYPQFPVGKYFIDFADPIKKIAIEVDGKEWHKDKLKDKLRDSNLNKMGWQVIRIQGRDTFKTREDYFTECFYDNLLDLEDEEAEEKNNILLKHYMRDCSEGMLKKLKIEYYQNND